MIMKINHRWVTGGVELIDTILQDFHKTYGNLLMMKY